VDYNRLLLVCAVLTRRAGISLASQDVIVNIAGGIRVAEPAADLAIALAIISSVRDVPLAQGTVAFGEIGLSGEVRPVSQHERRIAEAARLGLGRCLVPSVRDGVPQNGEAGIDTVPVSSLRQAVRSTMPSKRVGRPEGVFESMIEEGRT
jgi:DNA repair protein RadA/Sms